jgi:hypothetical protein
MDKQKFNFCLSIPVSFTLLIYFSVGTLSADPVKGDLLKLSEITEEAVYTFDMLEVMIDSSQHYSLEHLETDTFNSGFQQMKGFRNKDFNPNYTYWVRMSFDHSNVNSFWLLEFFDQTIDNVEAFVQNEAGDYENHRFGDSYPYPQRTFLHKNFHVLLGNPDQVQTVYFKIRSHRYADIRIALRSVNRFVYYALNEYFLYGCFYGIIMIVCLYNLLMFGVIREPKYIYYACYLFCVAVYAMCVDGIAYQYLWPQWPAWNQLAAGIFIYFIILFAIIFSRHFLNTKIRVPQIDRVLIYALLARTCLFVFALLFDTNLLYVREIEISILGFIFYAGIRVYLKGYRPARFFVLAYGILFIGFFLKLLIYLNLIPLTTFSYYILHGCFLLEMLFLSFALADRVRVLKSNRDRAYKRIIQQLEENAELKEKVNRELEIKVQERTLELNEKNALLEESNQKLQQQAQEINQINSMLDLDNWKLKSNLKEVLKDRVFHKKLSFEEFRQIFPNEMACLQYLEKLKWEASYHCKKCNNEKHSEGAKPFSKRCSRCGYDESVTAHTIFQGLRFPIEKAFYIMYVIMDQDYNITLNQLSEILDLRRNTIWNFKQKTLNAMKNDSLKFGDHTTYWQEIMIDIGSKVSVKKKIKIS